ncbi:MAG: His-Xaa-Ser system protein HxsD [Silvibacterium sp.]
MESVETRVAGETLVVDMEVISKDAILKACYWFSRDFYCEITELPNSRLQVSLSPKESAITDAVLSCKGDFLNTAMDFELRSQIEAKTSSIRELILAKAFAESGVLEDPPIGLFGDAVEEKKPDGLFKILDSGHH